MTIDKLLIALLLIFIALSVSCNAMADDYDPLLITKSYIDRGITKEQEEILLKTYSWFPMKQMIQLAVVNNKVRKGRVTIIRIRWK